MAGDLRDRSCLLRCSLLLKARLQNWHLYFLSGTSEVFREAGVDAADDGMAATLAPGILLTVALVGWLLAGPLSAKLVVACRRTARQRQRHSEVELALAER